MKKKAFVTGANGFIGTSLVTELVKRHYRVCCLVRSISKTAHLPAEHIELVQGNLLDQDSFAAQISTAEIIFHVAGVTKAANKKDYFQGNLETTRALVDVIRSHAPPLKKMIFISSQAAGSPCSEPPGTDETAADRVPVSVYGQSKKQAEKEVLSLADQFAVVVLRPSIVFGPRDRGMLPLFRSVARGIRIKSGRRRFPVSLVYIDDLVEAMMLSAESGKADGKIFNVSDGRCWSWDTLNETIAGHVNPRSKNFPLPLPVIWLAGRINGVLGSVFRYNPYLNPDKWLEIKQNGWVCDSSRIQTELGFSPRWDLDSAIGNTAAWYRRQGLL